MGKPTLTLRCGAASLNLNDQSTYYLTQDFIPPAIAFVPQVASGSSANIYGGSKLVGWSTANRDLTFTLTVKGSSGAHIAESVRRVDDMLRRASGVTPLHLEYCVNDTTIKPAWGNRGDTLSYEIVHGTITAGDGYFVGVRRNEDINIIVSLTIKPFASGQAQQICMASGGILEDTWGSSEGLSRGLIIPEATTNKMTNPVFGHATFGNGWTAGANLTATANTDPSYMIPGTLNSARLQRTGAANTYTQSIAAGNTNKHSLGILVKLHGGDALTLSAGLITDIELKYGASVVQTSNYIYLGDSWYWLRYENFDGVAAAQDVGVTVVTYAPIYLAAIQLEEKGYCTWPAWGDLLGCTWTSTAHASTSTRGVASCKLPNTVISTAQGSLRAIIKYHQSNIFSGNMHIADLRDGSNTNALLFTFLAADDKFTIWLNGAALVQSSAKTFTADTTYVIHFTWNAQTGSAKIYVNGVEDGTTSSFVYIAPGASLWIGSNYVPVNQTPGSFIDFATFDCVLTATEVANDYANILPLVLTNQRIGTIPWMYTDDGDNVLSLDTGKQPLCVISGIPGNVPAVTEVRGTLSSTWTTVKGILFSNFVAPIPIKLDTLLADQSGTAGGATEYGGQHLETTVTGAEDVIADGPLISAAYAKYFEDIEYHVAARMKGDSAATISIYPYGTFAYGPARIITLSTSYRLFRTHTHVINTHTDFNGLASPSQTVYLYALLSSGSVVVSVDYMIILPKPCLLLLLDGAGIKSFVLRGSMAYSIEDGTTNISKEINLVGDTIELAPNKYNMLQCYFGATETVDPLLTYTCTLDAIYVTPRWSLL